MAKGKKRHGRRGPRFGKYVNMVFKILGISVASSPAIAAVSENIGTPARIPLAVAYNYSGVDLSNGNFNPGKAAAGIAAIVVGIVLGKVGGLIGRSF